MIKYIRKLMLRERSRIGNINPSLIEADGKLSGAAANIIIGFFRNNYHKYAKQTISQITFVEAILVLSMYYLMLTAERKITKAYLHFYKQLFYSSL